MIFWRLTSRFVNPLGPFISINISYRTNMENFFNNKELLQLVIISFILVTLMYDSGMIL